MGIDRQGHGAYIERTFGAVTEDAETECYEYQRLRRCDGMRKDTLESNPIGVLLAEVIDQPIKVPVRVECAENGRENEKQKGKPFFHGKDSFLSPGLLPGTPTRAAGPCNPIYGPIGKNGAGLTEPCV